MGGDGREVSASMIADSSVEVGDDEAGGRESSEVLTKFSFEVVLGSVLNHANGDGGQLLRSSLNDAFEEKGEILKGQAVSRMGVGDMGGFQPGSTLCLGRGDEISGGFQQGRGGISARTSTVSTDKLEQPR